MTRRLPPGPDEWLRRARRNLRIAKSNLDAGFADAAAFYAQQAAELGLKALQIHQTGSFDKIHFLERLARNVGAPPQIIRLAALTSPAYTAAICPDIAGKIKKESATRIIDAARRIVRWVRRQMV